MANVLIIDDNDTMREGMAVTVKKQGHEVLAFRAGAEGVEAYKKSPADLVVTDLKMEAMDGIEVTRRIKALDPGAVVLVVTGFGTIETAVEAMQKGASDFVQKPFSPEMLRAKVDAALDLSKTRAQVQRLKATAHALMNDTRSAVERALIGDSEPMARLVSQVKKAAASEATVIIHGESGTGKELVARMLHDLSPRADGPFVVTHCAALAETLLESELFGHERGSFTGAVKRKLGRFELADGGTLFLDEIGDMSFKTQAKVLRALEEQSFERVGGKDTVKVDVRVIAASNRDLQSLIRDGRFREDLFYRLNVIPIEVPPLRARTEDVPLLVDHFIRVFSVENGKRTKTLSGEALAYFLAYDWPGNVRELRNMVERLVIMAPRDVIEAEDLPAPLRPKERWGDGGEARERTLREARDGFERAYILAELRANDWNVTRASERLGIERSHLYRKIKAYGIAAPK